MLARRSRPGSAKIKHLSIQGETDKSKEGCSLTTGKKLNSLKVICEKHATQQKENSKDNPFR